MIANLNVDLILWGAGGHGLVVLDVARSMSSTSKICFIDDDRRRDGQDIDGCRVLGDSTILTTLANTQFVVSIGQNALRAQCFERGIAAGLRPISLKHRSAMISPSAKIGPGTVVMPGAIINHGAHVGRNCIINSGAIVEHECVIDDHVHLSPRAALGGNVRIRQFAHIGMGAVVLPNTEVGMQSTVGAGAVVLHDIGPNLVVVGVPAKKLPAGSAAT
jgi:sugar O-acyltransferase (sialic acid O-acetyltransferase NeuD family)